MEDKRIVEIDGVKIEVDLRTAKRIDTFRVGDNVKVLCKEYDGVKIKPGIITDFANFKEKPTIVVAVLEESYSGVSINFVHIYEGMEEQYEIVYATEDEVKLSQEGVVEKFEREIAKKKHEMEELQFKLDFFKRHFMKSKEEVLDAGTD